MSSERPAATSRPRNGFSAVLRRPQFSLLVAGQTVSQFGDKLHHMALIALVGSEAVVETSGVALAQLSIVFTLPMILAPLAGALVDRWNKRLTMILCDLARVLLVVTIPWVYRASGRLWPIYIIAFAVFSAGVFFNAAKMAIIPDLVRREQLLPANAALTFIGRFATVFGIVGGGVIVGWEIWSRFGWTGYEAGFYLDAASYVISVLTLILMTLLSSAYSRRAASMLTTAETAAVVKREIQHLRGDIKETMVLIRTHQELRFSFGTVILLAALAASVYVVLTASVQSVMGQGARGVGILGGLAAAGMVLGSLAVGTIGADWNRRYTVLYGCLTIGLLMILGGSFFTFVAFVPIAFMAGVVLAPVMVSQDTLLHESAPAGARGLIFSTRDLVMGAAFMLAALLVGLGTRGLGLLGSNEPFRLALVILGVLISIASIGGVLRVIGGAKRAA